MTRATKLTDEVSEAICAHARMGMPLVRAAALSRINRITAWRWQSEGAAEIDAADDDAELGPRARFALNYGEARAAYLLELSTLTHVAQERRFRVRRTPTAVHTKGFGSALPCSRYP